MLIFSQVDLTSPSARLHPLYRIVVALFVFSVASFSQSLRVNATGSHVQQWTPASSTAIAINGVVSASAFGGFTSAAPGSWIEIYGSNLASDTRSWTSGDFHGVNAPTSLNGTSVTVGGQAAFVDYISPNQVNVQVPSNVLSGPQPVIVTTGNAVSSPYTFTINAEEPGLLAPSSFKVGGIQYVTALFSDGVTYVLPPGAIAGITSRRAKPGDNITFYGVGFGPVIPNTPAGQIVQQTNGLASFVLNFGQTQAAVSYAGLAPEAVGLYQFNVTVPNVVSSDQVPVTFTLGGVAGTQTLYISVQSGNTAPQVQSLTLSPTSVASGGSVQGTVVLSQPAPPGGAIVALSSNSTLATVPATVTVPEAAYSANFTITTGSVSSTQTATITAMYGGGSAQATLGITSAVSAPPFTSLVAELTFQPVGYPSTQGEILITPNAGNVTYTGSIQLEGDTLGFLNGTASNQAFTFSQLEGSPLVAFGSTALQLSSASLTVTLNQTFSGDGVASGNLTGTLSITGTPYEVGGASVTVSGALIGTYDATLATQ